jgi:hypothetical protein
VAEAATVAWRALVDEFETPGSLRLVRWVLFSEPDLRAYEAARRALGV